LLHSSFLLRNAISMTMTPYCNGRNATYRKRAKRHFATCRQAGKCFENAP
jgi:hypothetical protein